MCSRSGSFQDVLRARSLQLLMRDRMKKGGHGGGGRNAGLWPNYWEEQGGREAAAEAKKKREEEAAAKRSRQTTTRGRPPGRRWSRAPRSRRKRAPLRRLRLLSAARRASTRPPALRHRLRRTPSRLRRAAHDLQWLADACGGWLCNNNNNNKGSSTRGASSLVKRPPSIRASLTANGPGCGLPRSCFPTGEPLTTQWR